MFRKMAFLTCLTVVFGLSFTNQAAAQDPNLLGWWKLDEKSGNIAYDSSIYGNHGNLIQTDGTPIGVPQWVYGYAGGALWLDGVDDYVEVPHSETLWPDTEVTLMAWINTPRYTGAEASAWSNYQAIITKGNDPRMCSLYITTDDDGRGVLHLSVGETFTGSTSIASVPLNEWVHVCAEVINGGHLYYFNGEPSNPADEAGQGSVIAYGEEALRIGNAPENNSFLGKIDDVRIYNGALSQEEIQLIMISGLSSAATLPNPDNAAQEVVRDTSLTWKEGQYSDTHNVYFGTDFNDVSEASISDPRSVLVAENYTDTKFEFPEADHLLDYNTTYYWRVDEINDSEPNSPWKGETWSFTTLNYLTVDDFESYDDANNIVYDTWSDYFVNNTGMTVGYIEATSMERDIKHTGLQSMPLQYDNDGTINEGTDLETTGTSFYSEAELQFAEPQDWTRDEVESLTIWFRGHPAKVSSFVEEPAGIYTVKGIGNDIYDRSDEFHFAYKQVEGAVKIIVKVDSMDNTDPFAKAGIMIRDTLDTNARYCGLFMTPENGVRYQYRSRVNESTERQFDPNVAVPYWLYLERTAGGLVRGARYSENGSDWSSFSLTSVAMTDPIYIGLAVTSHNPSVPCEAKFSNLSFPDMTVGPEWTTKDIGILTNEAEQMYVVLNGNAFVFHDDPNAVLTDQWTQWNIPLQRFTEQNVDLTNINSLGIRIGDMDNQQPGGKGIIYIDDVRLYRSAISDDN
jgi:hypothetical protein